MRTLRLLIAIALAGAALCCGGAPARVAAATLPCAASNGHVTLVVEHGDGTVLQRCVGISGTNVSGEAVLAASGVEYSPGDELCQVDSEPSSYSPQCLQAGKPYWAIFIAPQGGSWTYANFGITYPQLHSGDALGLRFETGGHTPDAAPTACAAPTTAPSTHSPSKTSPANATAYPAAKSQQSAQPAATQNTPATASATTSPTGGVKGVATHVANTAVPPTAGISLALLLACLFGGCFLGLFVVRALRR
jgi:hypothetical protein